MTWRIPVVVSVIAALACARTPSAASVSGGDQLLPPGTFRRTLDHDGRERSYLVHLPAQAASGDPLPVILNFHGGGGNAQGQEDYSRMDAVADEAGFIAVYPEGTGRFGGYLLTWNAGGCCGYATTGFPIRRSSDQRLYTASRGLSQCPTSFIGT